MKKWRVYKSVYVHCIFTNIFHGVYYFILRYLQIFLKHVYWFKGPCMVTMIIIEGVLRLTTSPTVYVYVQFKKSIVNDFRKRTLFLDWFPLMPVRVCIVYAYLIVIIHVNIIYIVNIINEDLYLFTFKPNLYPHLFYF